MLSDLFYRKKRLLLLAVGLIVVAGFASLETLPRQEDPALSRRFADILTLYPGATADRVESLISEKIETHLQEVHEIALIESISRTGQSVVRIELEEQYSEEYVDEIWSRVRDKLSDVVPELPEGASEPVFEDRTSTAITLLVGLTWELPGEPELGLLTRLAEELENRLRVLPGTKETELHGEAAEELRVSVDPLQLAEIGLDPARFARAIASADTRRPAGQLLRAESAMPLEVAGKLSSVERVRRVPLRSGEDGRVLRVGDVARVEKTRSDPPDTIALLGGHRGVAVSATMLARSGRVDQWTAMARRVIEDYRQEIPPGIGYAILFDQSLYTGARLGSLVGNLALGAGIVIGVLLFMMGLRSALVVASILPLTLLLVLVELKFFGVPLHQMSVTGLIIALGLLIDNAIVVVDEYERRLRQGAQTAEAIREVVRDLFVPLGASSLTTVLAFMPIALMPGPGGEFTGTIAIGVSLSVVSSFALSMTLILAFAGHLIPAAVENDPGRQGRFAHGYVHPGLRERFRQSLLLVLRRPALGIAFGLFLPLCGFAVAGTLSQQFFPANDRDQFQIQLDLPAHYPIEASLEIVERVRGIVEAREAVLESHWFVGEQSPRVYYNMLGNYDIPNFAAGFVRTRSAQATEEMLADLQQELRRAVPEAMAIALPFEQGPPFDAPIEIRVVGPDLDVLRRLGDDLRRILVESEAVTYTRSKLLGGRPKLMVAASEDEVQLAGLRLGDVADQLSAALDGAIAGRIIEATEDIPIRVRWTGLERGSIERILSSRVLADPGAGGSNAARGNLEGIPLRALGGIELTPELAAITRRNGERINTVQAFLVPYHLIQDSLDDFNARLAASGFEPPPGYRLEAGGDFEERQDAVSNLAAFALPLFLLMGGAIVLTFDSFRLASIIFGVAGLSVGLALFSVWLFDHPMGFIVIVGTMGLVGLAINDAIVMLNALRLDARSAAGEPEPTAAVVLDATRHIVSTTLTTVGGFLPLILFGGRFWPPMATAIAGGVIGAMVLALYFVPALFVLTRRRRESGAAVDAVDGIGAAGAISGSTSVPRPYSASGLGDASP
jgi:multidrug efflux pump subunit AcrB